MTRVLALALALFACDDETPVPVVVPPSRPAVPRTFPTDQATIDSLTARADVVSDPGPATTPGGGGGAGTKTLSVAERSRGRRTSLTEEILVDSARAAAQPRSDEPCEEAYESTVAILEQMRARDGEGRYPRPDRASFMTGCRSHPPAVQRCLAPSYFRGNSAECQRVMGVRGASATRDVPQAVADPSGEAPAEETP